jgi:hypothetical protein
MKLNKKEIFVMILSKILFWDKVAELHERAVKFREGK